jgi:hypothetical protein
MAKQTKKKIDDRVKDILKKHGFDWQECLWDCHGTWVMYHKWIEVAAAQNNITWELHDVEFDTKNKIAVVKCNAKFGDKTISTYGEAAPHNCKNLYTVAMAEKRAVDRAVLKLLGLHGFIYSEEEVDKEPASIVPMPKKETERSIQDHIYILKELSKDAKLKYWYSLNPEMRNSIRAISDEFASK